MNYKPGRIAETQEANVIDLQPEELRKEQVGGLVDDHAGERKHGNDRAGNEEHVTLSLFGLPTAEFPVVLCFADDRAAVEPMADSFLVFLKVLLLSRIVPDLVASGG